MQPDQEASRRQPLGLLLPLVAYAYPLAFGLLSRSITPEILGRYSKVFLAFNVWNVALVALALFGWKRGRTGILILAYALIIATTTIAPANSQVQEMPGLTLMMVLTRLTCAGAILFAAFLQSRGSGENPRPLALGIGAMVLALSLIDLALLGVLSLRPAEQRTDAGLRVEYSLDRITADDLVLVGDSFVWGQGVEIEERMGDQLAELRTESGRQGQVYSLGVRGTNLRDHAEQLGRLDAATPVESVVVAFYMNDMPPPTPLRRRMVNLLKSFGISVPTLRLVADKLAQLTTPDVDSYHQFVVDCYDEQAPGFGPRWERLEDHISDIGEKATTYSRKQPLFVIIPLLVPYQGYPLDAAHHKVAERAEDAGFEVLDLLPSFRNELVDGTRHRAAENDNHFDAETHRRVAEWMFAALQEPEPSLAPRPAGTTDRR